MSDYFRMNEAEQFTFFRIPKILFTDRKYTSLSTDARVLYGVLLDRKQISVILIHDSRSNILQLHISDKWANIIGNQTLTAFVSGHCPGVHAVD